MYLIPPKNVLFSIIILSQDIILVKSFSFIKPREVYDERVLKSLRTFSSEENGDFEEVEFDNQEEGIKKLLEDRYKFKNDNISTRFKVTRDERDYGALYCSFLSRTYKMWNELPPEVFLERYDKEQARKVQKELFFKAGDALATPLVLQVSIGDVFPKSVTEEHLAAVFRSYAVRRIVGGMETSISMYPYTVAISRSGKHWCGGSIIDEQWVFTAGHCLESAIDGDKKKLQPFLIRAGSSFHNRGGYQARVNKVFFPGEYTPGNADYDFSLLRLDRPMPIGRNIAVLNLPASDYLVKNDDLLIVTGWGSTDVSGYGHIPDRLRFVPVPVMKEEDCQDAYRFYITPRMLCAGYATGGKDACNHDSGGPAVRDGVLLGIVSFGGKHCGDPRSPGVYSRVAEVTEWVEKTITANEADTVPELQAKIRKARQREKELQRFKARVEDKKNKIKNWLRETLKSPTFLRLAKKKLKEAGFYTRRSFFDIEDESTVMDDKTMDEINLSNLISERILGDYDENESEVLLTALALQEVMLNEGVKEEMIPVYRNREANDATIESLVAYVGK